MVNVGKGLLNSSGTQAEDRCWSPIARSAQLADAGPPASFRRMSGHNSSEANFPVAPVESRPASQRHS